MKRPSSIQLSIPSPCSENWDAMTPDAQGRFCAHCQKSVIDFTGWNNAALHEFFAKNNTPACGRLRNDQLNRTINIPPQPHSKLYRIVVALGLTIFVVQAHDARAQARVQPPFTEQNVLTATQNNDSTHTDSVVISGQVLDEQKQPMIGVIVQMESDKGVAIGGAQTDIDGNFSIPVSDSMRVFLKDTDLQLRFSYTAYKTSIVPIDLTRNNAIKPICMQLVPGTLTGLMIIKKAQYKTSLIDIGKPNSKTINNKDIHNMGY